MQDQRDFFALTVRMTATITVPPIPISATMAISMISGFPD